jgi:hypothetical protein
MGVELSRFALFRNPISCLKSRFGVLIHSPDLLRRNDIIASIGWLRLGHRGARPQLRPLRLAKVKEFSHAILPGALLLVILRLVDLTKVTVSTPVDWANSQP